MSDTKSIRSKTNKILFEPAPGTVVKPIWTYNEEQKAKIEVLREYAQSLRLPDSDPYAEWEARWLARPETIPRYIRAAKWKLEDGKKRIQKTLEWRREYKPELIPPEEVKIEAETGKIILTGFDVDGRPIIYMRPGRENTQTSPRQLRHLVWVLERATDLMPPGQESLMIIVDYKSTSLRTNPSVSVASKVLVILQQHYCERLGRAIVTNLPMILKFFYSGIQPFLDPVTRDKMRFNPDLFELVPKSQLDADLGGDYNFEYDFESYWSQMVEHCNIAPDGTRLNKDATLEATAPATTAEASSTAVEPPATSAADANENPHTGTTMSEFMSTPDSTGEDPDGLPATSPQAIAVIA
ncbi:CRAL/TRIO domain-containing protein [Peniophora sp. CONT]|nr:CRAL/TRIO domain-containing protein [Peniophora sp. CONT]